MSNQPEALRLAHELFMDPGVEDCVAAAAELRRLAAVEAQRDALLDEIQTHSAAVYECTRLLAEARGQRDALLEALKGLVAYHGAHDKWHKRFDFVFDKARAAIKAVEGEMK